MRLRDKVVEYSHNARIVALTIFMAFMLVQFVCGVVYAMSKQVSIVDDKGEEISFITYASNTAEVLAEKNVTLGEYDETSIPMDSKVKDGDVIYVYRADTVKFVDGKETSVMITAMPDVESFLESRGIDPHGSILTNVALEEKIVENMEICVIYVEEKMVNAEEVIKYNTQRIANSKMSPGTTKVVKEGADGLADRVYREYYENGELISRDVVKETVKVAAVDSVVEYGPVPTQKIAYSNTNVSRASQYRYSKCIDVVATAYCSGTTTATGMKVRYGVVAVDPRVIPLGTRLYVEAANGTWVYGTAIAADTGGAVKGNIIDLYVGSYAEAINFGRRKAKVYILE